jgi:hypothetical protein
MSHSITAPIRRNARGAKPVNFTPENHGCREKIVDQTGSNMLGRARIDRPKYWMYKFELYKYYHKRLEYTRDPWFHHCRMSNPDPFTPESGVRKTKAHDPGFSGAKRKKSGKYSVHLN